MSTYKAKEINCIICGEITKEVPSKWCTYCMMIAYNHDITWREADKYRYKVVEWVLKNCYKSQDRYFEKSSRLCRFDKSSNDIMEKRERYDEILIKIERRIDYIKLNYEEV